VRAGEALAILGPSGSGKSTLLNMIAGLDKPSTGSVTVDGVRVDTLNETASAKYRRTHIGMVFQFFNLLDDLTVTDNVRLPAQLAGMQSARANERAAELLRYLGVDRLAHAYPGRLSGGERQRVAVARALMNRPTILLADEPTGDGHTATVRIVGEVFDVESTVALLTDTSSLDRAVAVVRQDSPGRLWR
jgi:putative ABC transport system ATP-binding protein